MKVIRILTIIIASLYLSACAIMDITHQNTAVPLPEGDLQVSAYWGLGLDLSTMAEFPDAEEVEDPHLGFSPVSGLTAYFGLDPDLELQVKAYAGTNSQGIKLGCKRLVFHNGNRYVSVLPAVTAVSNGVIVNTDEGERSYQSIGLEGSVINSWVLGRNFTSSLGTRISYNRLTRIENDHEDGPPYNIFHGGLMGNMMISLGSFIILPELGVEFAPNQKQKIEIIPSPALGLGIKF